MPKILKAILTTLAILAGSNAIAQESLIDDLVAACETDLNSYCSTVTPGEGRLLLCMAAHEDKISGQCQYAFYQTSALLEQLAVAVNYVAQECQTDIQTHCAGVKMGEGRVLTCLAENDEKVSASCKTAIAETVSVE
jgi:hypothetical protein